MLSTRLLVRTAVRLQNFWRSRACLAGRTECHELARFCERMQSLQHELDRLDKARGCQLELSMPFLRLSLLDHLESVMLAASAAKDALTRPGPPIPGLAFFMAELQQIDGDFAGCRIDMKKKLIRADTEAITLQDIYLGPFAIHFHWERVLHHADVSCFDLVAIDPNPAAANSRVTHPHVKDGNLCAGEACSPIRKALEQGRLADAFCLVRSVLEHYNPTSPFVSLEEWTGTECHNCGRSVREDDQGSCEGCGCYFCDDCIGGCTCCGTYRCDGCMGRCESCSETYCARCLTECAVSSKVCCQSCIDDCVRCGASVARDELDDNGICTSCQDEPAEPSPETIHDSHSEPDRLDTA